MRNKSFNAKPSPSWIRRQLLRWYEQNKRELPWRKTRDPYAIWVSETMLQQTQVKTVLPYYRRFLRRFPTLRALARAPRDKVLALWSGLGYYRRADNIRNAARVIMKEHSGRIPQGFNALRALPGIGDYTAGAVASIAFKQPYPALDGNARRVLRRLFHAENGKALSQLSKSLLSLSRPGDFNQALMDLGALICLPRNPDCPTCPCNRLCMARRSGSYEIHKSKSRRQSAKVVWPLALITQNGKILLRRRPEEGLLAGLWEIPGGKKKSGEAPRDALKRQLKNLNSVVDRIKLVGEVRHSITRYRIRAPVYVSSVRVNRLPQGAEWRWVPPSSIGRYPISSLSLKAIRFADRVAQAAGKPRVSNMP